MEYNEVKRCLETCPDLAGLEDSSLAFLLWRGEERLCDPDEVVYAEGTKLDDSFCLQLSGVTLVEQRGATIGEIAAGHIFGEMAYFSPLHERSATVRVGIERVSVLKIHLTLQELESEQFSVLRTYMGLHAWDRFVNSSESVG
jgi:CRP-like cAMP-binding protein